ncbi:hypothetical protein BDK51DRAFT_50588 [Blyttiomyces helicus]|uniref:Uncharacterized protein n=1 Tax=Blyttiomyces helicus TaxID=388810 RepID=A0A4P9VX18_9FUNG|nr:hypothetical protein BDK51DRAFT_50588 [Blyttiomyces helicus]|eukprot:RKO82820.1 hypothetical protein BDK51DRAFT_50588 [Blyttiomyces helicus]
MGHPTESGEQGAMGHPTESGGDLAMGHPTEWGEQIGSGRDGESDRIGSGRRVCTGRSPRGSSASERCTSVSHARSPLLPFGAPKGGVLCAWVTPVHPSSGNGVQGGLLLPTLTHPSMTLRSSTPPPPWCSSDPIRADPTRPDLTRLSTLNSEETPGLGGGIGASDRIGSGRVGGSSDRGGG